MGYVYIYYLLFNSNFLVYFGHPPLYPPEIDPPVLEAKSQERKRELEQLRKQLASATVLDSRAPRFSIFGAWQAWL